MVWLVVQPRRLVPAGAGSHVDLAADDRMDAGGLGRFIELDHAVHNAVVGDRQSLHAQFLGPGHQLVDLAGAVQKAVAGMGMQMHKFRHGKNLRKFAPAKNTAYRCAQ